MKESKIRDREDPDSFTIAALPPSAKRDEKTAMKVRELRLHMAFILLFLSGSLCFNNSSGTSKSPCWHKKKKPNPAEWKITENSIHARTRNESFVFFSGNLLTSSQYVLAPLQQISNHLSLPEEIITALAQTCYSGTNNPKFISGLKSLLCIQFPWCRDAEVFNNRL